MRWGVGEAEPPAFDDPPSRGELEIAHENLVAWFRVLATSSDGGRVDEDEGYLCFAGVHEYPGTYTNGVVRTASPGATTPAELLARADAFFGQLGRPYVTWVRAGFDSEPDADLDVELQRRGHWLRPPHAGSELIWTRLGAGFAEDVDPAPAGIVVSRADEDVDRRAFLRLVADSYGLAGADLALAEALLFSLQSLRAPGVHLHVARDVVTDRVCGGMVTFDAAGGVQLGWNVTDPAVRGRGIASAVMRVSVHDAFDRGARYASGVASQQGVPLWRKLGFHLPVRYKRYVAATPDPVAPVASSAPRSRRGSAGAFGGSAR